MLDNFLARVARNERLQLHQLIKLDHLASIAIKLLAVGLLFIAINAVAYIVFVATDTPDDQLQEMQQFFDKWRAEQVEKGSK